MIARKPPDIPVGQHAIANGSGNTMGDERSLNHLSGANTSAESETDNRRWLYRRTVYRIAHARLRDELATGLSGMTAAWIALRETAANCSLTTAESAALLRSLLAATGHADPHR